LTLVLSARAFQGDLVHGNVNLFILLLVVVSLSAFTHGNRRARSLSDWSSAWKLDWTWDITAGLTMGLAIACKLTPALFLPYFLWKRAWGVATATVIGIALFTFVVPSLFGGWCANLSHLESWYTHMAQPFLTKGDVLYSKH